MKKAHETLPFKFSATRVGSQLPTTISGKSCVSLSDKYSAEFGRILNSVFQAFKNICWR